ncbi:MAG: hypothetical protein JNM94_17790 [Phycisphaerae bacterium]|nr:hypothetical protein [Phycisphaerae bacterium]
MTIRNPVRVATRSSRLALAALLLPLTLASPTVAQAPGNADAATAKAAPVQQRIDLRVAKAAEVAGVLSSQLGVQANAVESANCLYILGSVDQLQEAERVARTLDERAMMILAERAHDEAMAKERDRSIAQANANDAAARLANLSLTIDFPGGSVSEYLDFVRKASGFDNVVVGDDAILALKMPRVKVRRVTGTAAVLLLQTLRFDSNGNDVRLAVENIPGDPDGLGIDAMPVLVIDFDARSRTAIPSAAIVTQVINLSAYQKYEPETVKALLGALDVAVKMQGDPKNVEIKLHEGTGLLFVKGNERDVNLINETVNTFVGDRPTPQTN